MAVVLHIGMGFAQHQAHAARLKNLRKIDRIGLSAVAIAIRIGIGPLQRVDGIEALRVDFFYRRIHTETRGPVLSGTHLGAFEIVGTGLAVGFKPRAFRCFGRTDRILSCENLNHTAQCGAAIQTRHIATNHFNALNATQGQMLKCSQIEVQIVHGQAVYQHQRMARFGAAHEQGGNTAHAARLTDFHARQVLQQCGHVSRL